MNHLKKRIRAAKVSINRWLRFPGPLQSSKVNETSKLLTKLRTANSKHVHGNKISQLLDEVEKVIG